MEIRSLGRILKRPVKEDQPVKVTVQLPLEDDFNHQAAKVIMVHREVNLCRFFVIGPVTRAGGNSWRPSMNSIPTLIGSNRYVLTDMLAAQTMLVTMNTRWYEHKRSGIEVKTPPILPSMQTGSFDDMIKLLKSSVRASMEEGYNMYRVFYNDGSMVTTKEALFKTPTATQVKKESV